jgi:hypothetical protein
VLGGQFSAAPDELHRLAADVRALILDPPGTDVTPAR